VNFLALLGWAPDGETTIMSRDELIERFSLERVTPSSAQFDYAKLDWMNGVYLRALPEEEFAHAVILWLGEQGYEWDAVLVRKTAPLVQEKLTRLDEFPAYARFLFEEVSPDRRSSTARPGDRGGEGRARAARAVHGGVDRGGAARRRGSARSEAAAGVPAATDCDHGVEGVTRPVREH